MSRRNSTELFSWPSVMVTTMTCSASASTAPRAAARRSARAKQSPSRVEERRPRPRNECGHGEGPNFADRLAVREDLMRILRVELHERQPGIVAVGLLLAEERVEAADDVRADRLHRPRPVEQDVDVSAGVDVHAPSTRARPRCDNPPLPATLGRGATGGGASGAFVKSAAGRTYHPCVPRRRQPSASSLRSRAVVRRRRSPPSRLLRRRRRRRRRLRRPRGSWSRASAQPRHSASTGFGASGAWWPNDLVKFPPDVQHRVGDLLFGVDGLPRGWECVMELTSPGAGSSTNLPSVATACSQRSARGARRDSSSTT